MPNSRSTTMRNQGGKRRNIRMPCGKIFQGQPERLKGVISAHQKVCLECSCRDCSFAWKEQFSKCPNATDIRGSNSGATNNYKNAQTLTALNSDGERLTTTVPKIGGLYDTITKLSEDLISEGGASFSGKTSKPNKKRKGKKKKKSKVQSDWAEVPEQTDTDQVSILIPLDGDLDENYTRLLQSITDDLSMDEILELLTSRGINFATLTD